MSTKRYEEVTTWLFQQFPSYQLIGQQAYKPTLENTRRLLARIGNPENSLKFVHVAGSNGKGSVCSMLSSILTENGLKVGLFTSPHIVDFRERIRINGECIEETHVIDFVDKINAEAWDFSPSFFEISFAMALYHFQQRACDICVIETGLGGRLDASNVIQPLATAITSISLEHTQILGNTLSEIAREKGGIIKEGIPMVLGELPVEARAVLIPMAEDKQAPLHFTGAQDLSHYTIPLPGAHQVGNFRVVLKLLDILSAHFKLNESAVEAGLTHLHRNTGFMGRLQVISTNPLVIYDVSHNAEGLNASLNTVRTMLKGALHIVYGTSNDKDLSQIIHCFLPEDLLYLSEFENPRSMKIEQLATFFAATNLHVVGKFKRGPEALKSASSSCSTEDIILVTGSFFLLSDFFQKNI
jgi:dihydrofolate synthase/folylpolyglutamate synthase